MTAPTIDPVAFVDLHPELAAAYGREQLLASITATLEPLPANRLWQVRARRRTPSRVGALADRIAQHLEPPPGTSPQPRCEPWCLAQHSARAGAA